MNDRAISAPSLGSSRPLATPLYTASVYAIPDLDTLDRIVNHEEPGFCYARDDHPNARSLAAKLAAAEGGDWAAVCGSGMAAIGAIFATTLGQGSRVVASNRLYGRTTQLLAQELSRFGVRTDFVDSTSTAIVARALETPAKLLFVETLSNPLLAVSDIDALAEISRSRGCLLVVDNTFATPALCRPLERGADLVMESLTKMIGGHSDVTLGLIAGRSGLTAEIARTVSVWGFASNPFDCWLAERGVATLDLRMRAACTNAAAIADWLAAHPQVQRVVYPGRKDHPGHAVAARLLGGRFGNMLSFELAGGREAVNRFMRRATGVPFSPSLGDTMTTCSHPYSTSHRYVPADEKVGQGITEGLIRLSVGVEDLECIRSEMAKGLA
jgi:cystathionine beta-lyase/cystathionine gamma-synthase